MKLIQVSNSPTVKWQRLWEFPERGSNGWRCLKVEIGVRKQKGERRQRRNFWLGHNGERWARNNDTAYLAERHPDVLAWAETQLAA